MDKKKFKQAIGLIQKLQHEKLENDNVVYCKNLVEVEITDLHRPAYSSRVIIDNRLSVLSDNLIQFGFLGGIFVHAQNYNVIDGWHRLKIWESLGRTTIPCHFVDCNSKEEIQLHLRLNQQVAAFDLHSFDLGLMNFNLLEYGFTQDELYTDISNEPYQSFDKKQAPEGFVKLQTLVSKSAYARLKARRAEFNVKSVANVIERLA